MLKLAKNVQTPNQWVLDRFEHHLARRIAAGTARDEAVALEIEELRKDRQALFDYDPSKAPDPAVVAAYDAAIKLLSA